MWELQNHRGERLRERTGGAVFDIRLVNVSCPRLEGRNQQLNRCMSGFPHGLLWFEWWRKFVYKCYIPAAEYMAVACISWAASVRSGDSPCPLQLHHSTGLTAPARLLGMTSISADHLAAWGPLSNQSLAALPLANAGRTTTCLSSLLVILICVL